MSNDKNNKKEKPEELANQTEADSLESQLALKEKECAEFRDKFIRLAAEFDNARKRWDRDRNDLLKWGNSQLLSDMLIVLDEIEHALRLIKEHNNADGVIKGLEMTQKKFLEVFKQNGVEVMETQGKKFDPHAYEIISSRQAQGINEHTVLEEIQKGYMLEGKVLRTAKVVVGIPMEKSTENGVQSTIQQITENGVRSTEKKEEGEEGLGEA